MWAPGARTETAPVAAATTGADALVAPVAGASLEQTIADLQTRLQAQPDDARSLALLGLAYAQEATHTADPSYYPKAEEALQRSLELQPDGNVEALVGMGVVALARHDFAGGVRWGRLARQANPDAAHILGVIGDGQLELGHYQRAFATFHTMVSMRPDVASYARVSYARELVGDVRGALATMRQAADAAGTPDDAAWVSYQIGELSFRSGRLSAAVSAYRRAAALSPTFVPAEAGLAKIAWARGHVDRAIRGYRRVVARYPLPEHVIALGDLYTIEGRTAQADDAYALARAEAALFRSNGVNVDVELALFEADHGEPVAALADATGRLAITTQHPCRGRARLGPVSQRALAAGGPPGAAGASARHAGRALVLPRRHDRPAARRPRRGSADADARAGHQPALLDPVRNPGAADGRPAAPVSAPPTSCGPSGSAAPRSLPAHP